MRVSYRLTRIARSSGVLVAVMAVIAVLLTMAACERRHREDALFEQALGMITSQLAKSHVRFLSHDLLRGRGTGDVGFELAREYVVSQFERIGLKPGSGASYLQPFEVRTATGDLGSEIHVGDQVFTAAQVRFSPALEQGGESIWEGSALYLGYGLFSHGWNDYAGMDVTGKAVIVLSGTPSGWPMDRAAQRAAAAKTEYALRRGAALVIQLTNGEPQARPQTDPNPTRGAGPFAPADGTVTSIRPAATLGYDASQAVLRMWQVREPSEAIGAVGPIRIARRHALRTMTSWNVVGVIHGSDPVLRDEAVVFSSHLDHVGICAPDATGDNICNGTHDNALGIAKMLAAAEAMVRLRPRRSVVFVAAGAEEGGLIGSWHYVRNPVFPIEKTAANINMDGGRTGSKTDDVIPNAADFSEMAEIVEQVMAELGVSLTHGQSAAELVGLSSDHRSFLMAGVPAVDLKPGYSVNGDAEIGYRERIEYMNSRRHRPADTFDESFTFESPAEMARRAVHLAWYLANRDSMPRMLPEQPMARERSSPQQPYYFGSHYPIQP